MTTLWDILSDPIPESLQPEYASKKLASSTRDMRKAELNGNPGSKLHGIVYCEDLLEPVLKDGRARAENILIKDLKAELSQTWKAHVLHTGASFMLPPFINSEMDSTSWFNQVLGRPALASVLLVGDKACNLRSAFLATATTVSPFLISARHTQDKSIPDTLLMQGGSHAPGVKVNTKPRVVGELKTRNSLSDQTFELLCSTREDDSGNLIAVPFLYPGDGRKKKTHLSKLLVQLWGQMSQHGCDYGFLSSYHTTIFTYRSTRTAEVDGEKRRMNLMFLSQPYRIGTATLSPIFSWFLHALGPRKPIPLPEINAELVEKFMSEKQLKKLEKKIGYKFSVGPQTAYVDDKYY